MAPYIEICYADSGGRGGSHPRSSGFLQQRVAGQRQVLRIDCVRILNKPLPMLPKNRRTIIPATSGSAIFLPLSEEANFLFAIIMKNTPLQRKNVVERQPEKSVRQKTPFQL